MILVDSSVWIDFFNGTATRQADFLAATLGREPVATGDLILAEVLQGFRHDRDFERALEALRAFDCHTIGGPDIAVQAARNHRTLRRRGVTVRKTVDLLIGTWCIAHGLTLLHSDRDFDPMQRHLGLQVA